jgi:hypothetical protein
MKQLHCASPHTKVLKGKMFYVGASGNVHLMLALKIRFNIRFCSVLGCRLFLEHALGHFPPQQVALREWLMRSVGAELHAVQHGARRVWRISGHGREPCHGVPRWPGEQGSTSKAAKHVCRGRQRGAPHDGSHCSGCLRNRRLDLHRIVVYIHRGEHP